MILNQIHHLPLRLYVRLNVALGRAQGGMPREHLHVSERGHNCRTLNAAIEQQ